MEPPSSGRCGGGGGNRSGSDHISAAQVQSLQLSTVAAAGPASSTAKSESKGGAIAMMEGGRFQDRCLATASEQEAAGVGPSGGQGVRPGEGRGLLRELEAELLRLRDGLERLILRLHIGPESPVCGTCGCAGESAGGAPGPAEAKGGAASHETVDTASKGKGSGSRPHGSDGDARPRWLSEDAESSRREGGGGGFGAGSTKGQGSLRAKESPRQRRQPRLSPRPLSLVLAAPAAGPAALTAASQRFSGLAKGQGQSISFKSAMAEETAIVEPRAGVEAVKSEAAIWEQGRTSERRSAPSQGTEGPSQGAGKGQDPGQARALEAKDGPGTRRQVSHHICADSVPQLGSKACIVYILSWP